MQSGITAFRFFQLLENQHLLLHELLVPEKVVKVSILLHGHDLEGFIFIIVNLKPALLFIHLARGIRSVDLIEEEGRHALRADAVVHNLRPIPEILHLSVIVQLPLFGMSAFVFLAHKYQVVRSNVASE